MKGSRWLTSALLGIILAVPASAQKPDSREQQVLKASTTLNEAGYTTKNRATLERMYSDDFIYLHSNGTSNEKTQEVAELLSPDMKWTAHKTENQKVRVYGDVAILTGVSTLSGSAKGYMSGPRNFTEIWVMRDGRWQNVGGQATLASHK